MTKSKIKEIVKDYTQDLDKPFELSDSWQFLKKGKIKVVIHYEDKSYKEYYIHLKDDYTIKIKKMLYIVVPECFIFGKYNTIEYYYNNPLPMNYKYQHSKLKTADIRKHSKKQTSTLDVDTVLDSRILYTAFTSNLINKMYSEGEGMSTKNIIVIIVVALVVVMLLLQFTGVLDIGGALFTRGG